MSDESTIYDYRCVKCGSLVRTENLEWMAPPVMCWQAANGQCDPNGYHGYSRAYYYTVRPDRNDMSRILGVSKRGRREQRTARTSEPAALQGPNSPSVEKRRRRQ